MTRTFLQRIIPIDWRDGSLLTEYGLTNEEAGVPDPARLGTYVLGAQILVAAYSIRLLL